MQHETGRVLGTFVGSDAGPTVIITGAVHGNEPTGLYAARAVLDALEARQPRFFGRVIAVVGNRQALARKQRYIQRDLNRGWEPSHLDAIRRAHPNELVAEEREQRELLDLFAPWLAEATQPVVFIDLHSTSGPAAPFACMSDVIRNRKIAFSLGIPVVLGLEEAIQSSMVGYFCDLGHVGVAIEGGQHDDPHTQRMMEAGVWSALVACGSLQPAAVPDLEDRRRELRDAVRDLPSVIEIRHRHVCRDGDGFEMDEGYANFQLIDSNQRVARDRYGPISTPYHGIMMLPRYQGQGEDGYFIARRVEPTWLGISARLRRARADRILSWLPGVTPHARLPEHYRVDRTIARFRVIEIFHLLGYRRQQPEGRYWVFSRRRPDGRGPEPLPPVPVSAPLPARASCHDPKMMLSVDGG